VRAQRESTNVTNRRKRGLLFAMVVCAMAGAAAGQAIEVPLTFEKLGEKEDGLRGWYYQGEEVADGRLKLPSPNAYPSFFVLGGRQYYFAFDKANETDTFYSRLYFDANGNLDLTDDACIEAKEEPIDEDYALLNFPPFDVEYQLQGQTLPYSVSIYIMKYLKQEQARTTNQRPQFHVRNAGVWTGSLAVNGTEYKITFGDSNFDGNYGATISRRTDMPEYLVFGGDRVRVSRPGSVVTPYDSLVLTPNLFIGDNFYTVEVRTAERKAVLTPMAMPPIALKLEPEMYQVQLVSKDFKTGLCLFDPAGMVHIPPGTYYVASYISSRTDEQGDRWALMARGDLKTAMLTAGGAEAAATAAELPVGPPYRALIVNKENQFKKSRADAWQLILSVKGRGDEFVGGIRRVEGENTLYKFSKNRPNWPLEPEWKVVTEDGEVVASGVFEYG